MKNLIDKSDNTLRILILSATPMFDKPNEIGLTLNLLKPKVEFPIGLDFNQKFFSYKNVPFSYSYSRLSKKNF